MPSKQGSSDEPDSLQPLKFKETLHIATLIDACVGHLEQHQQIDVVQLIRYRKVLFEVLDMPDPERWEAMP
jgi:hypothetical protein